MEITPDELAAIFEKHHEMMYRWALPTDKTTRYPRSLDLNCRGGFENDPIMLDLTENIGPAQTRRISVPLEFLFNIWPTLEQFIRSRTSGSKAT